jgi:hypothetical protein
LRNWKRNGPRAISRRALPLLLGFILAVPSAADALGDLRATLGRLHGVEPVSATVDFQFWRQITESGKPAILQGGVLARAEDGPQGLRIGWDRSTLEQAEAEQRATALNSDIPAPTAQVMRSLTALDLAEHLHAGETLERLLLGATQQETRSEAWQGRPATLLVVRLAPVLSPAGLRSAVKEVTGQARIWLGPDGSPLAYAADVKYTGSRYWIRFQGFQKEEIHYLRTGNRLVAVWSQNEEHQSGLGQSMSTRRGFRIGLNP